MKKLPYTKLTAWGGALTAGFATLTNSALAGTVSHTNTFTINTSHTMNAVIGLGANASYADKASATLPLFNSSLGALNSATITATTVSPAFTGTLTAALLGLNVGYTQTQDVKYTLSNTGTGDTGAAVGPIGLSLTLGKTQNTISTTPATLASTVCYTNGAQLATFCGNGSGTFTLNGELDSYYNLGAVSALSSLQGDGSYPLQVTVTYDYGTTIATHQATMPQGGGALVLMYPTNATNLEFEATVGLNTNNWQTMTNGVTISNGNFILMVPTTLPQQFFRLHTKGGAQ